MHVHEQLGGYRLRSRAAPVVTRTNNTALLCEERREGGGEKAAAWGTYAAVALERVLLVVDVERVAEAQSGHAVAQAALTLRARNKPEAVQFSLSVRTLHLITRAISADYSSCIHVVEGDVQSTRMSEPGAPRANNIDKFTTYISYEHAAH